MSYFSLIISIVSGLIIFIYGLENFSKEMTEITGDKFRNILKNLTKNRFIGATLGALITAMIQSSTATTVITVGLVNAGTISFANSLGIIFGSNLGSTFTTQLVAINLTSYASIFLILGFFLSIIKNKLQYFGKVIFYFGLVFFGLYIVGEAIEPIKGNPYIVDIFAGLENFWLAFIVSTIFTGIIHSSAVTTGLAVLLIQNGIITLNEAMPIIFGANIGTTFASNYSSINLSIFAKRASLSHLLFNLIGVIIFLPFLSPFQNFVETTSNNPALQVANAHTLLNLINLIIFFLILPYFKRLVEWILPTTEEEILLDTKFLPQQLPENNETAITLIESEMKYSLEVNQKLQEESLSLLKLFDNKKVARIIKLEDLSDFLDEKIEHSLIEISKRLFIKENANRIVTLTRISNCLEQLGDITSDMTKLQRTFIEKGKKIPKEVTQILEKFFIPFIKEIKELRKHAFTNKLDKRKFKINSHHINIEINKNYKEHIALLKDHQDYSGGFFVESLSIMENAMNKFIEIRKLIFDYKK